MQFLSHHTLHSNVKRYPTPPQRTRIQSIQITPFFLSFSRFHLKQSTIPATLKHHYSLWLRYFTQTKGKKMAEQPQIPDPKRIDGKAVADEVQLQIQGEIAKLKEEFGGKTPGLAVVLVGERKDSQTYVRMKQQAAEKVGMRFILKNFPASIQQDQLLQEVQALNNDPEIHGLIVQLPLPEHIHEKEILDAVSYEKDIDGFHPLNIGKDIPIHYSTSPTTTKYII